VNQNKTAMAKVSNETFIVLSMFGVLVAFFILASLFVPRFFNITTISTQLSQQAELIILAIGVSFILISGHLDLSVGGIVGLGAVLSAYFCQRSTGAGMELAIGLGMPYWLSIVLTLLCCMAVGCINAFFITRMKVASIIVTLGTMSLARGIAFIITQGSQRNSGLPYIYKQLGSWSLVGTINVSVVLMLILVVIALIIEKKTIFGRTTYYIGANPVAAKLSGVKVERHHSLLFIASSLLAGIVGVIMGSIHNAGISSLGEGFEFDALVICLLGGTSIMGGFGSVMCCVVGAFILGIMSTSLNMLGLSPDIQTIIKGGITLVAILAQRFALDRRTS
jgi:ribose/xylose/arabinose/galactoside ABC-type transport system permease subunit